MLALQGYYDGNAVQTLEKIKAEKNQKLIITVLDETPKKADTSAKGSLAKYANTALWEEEDTAWEKAVAEKYGNT